MQFKAHYNFREVKSKGEKFTLPSKTVPDETLTVRQMLERHTRGLPVHASQKQAVYHGDVDLPDMERLELEDKQEILENAQQNITDIKDRLNKKAAKQKAAKEAAAKKALENQKPAEPKDGKTQSA